MAWTHLPTGQPGVWELRLDGRPNQGMLSFDISDNQQPTVLAGIVVSALNDAYDTIIRPVLAATPDDVYQARGWASRTAYADEIAVNKLIVDDQPANVRAEIEAAFATASYPRPLTPAQMTEWQQTIDRIIADHITEAAA